MGEGKAFHFNSAFITFHCFTSILPLFRKSLM